MTSTLRRATVSSILLGLVVALVLPTSSPTAAAAAKQVRVSAHRSTASVVVGSIARITGGTNRGRRGDAVQLERKDARGWHRIASARVTATRRYTFTVRPPVGRTTYRVVRPGTKGLSRGISNPVRILGLRPVRLSGHKSAATVVAGRPVRFAGSASAGRSGDVVRLERQDGKTWRAIGSARLTPRRGYVLQTRPAVGRKAYRVVRPSAGGYARAVSPTLRVRAVRCTPMARPVNAMVAWGNDPTVDRTSGLTKNLSRLFCSVAPRAKVRVALFLLSADSETEHIFDSLETVHRYLGVDVEFIVDRNPFPPKELPAKLKRRVAKFATLRTCRRSCHSDPSVNAVMHNKFVTVSDMNWAPGKDPVLWSSSSNWNKRQLRKYWQTSVLMYGDRRLTREFDARFESMRACGVRASRCTGWVPSVWGTRLPAEYRKVKVGRVWYDAGLSWRDGDPGDGTKVIFSPVTRGTDPMISELESYSCSPQHRTVRFAVYRLVEPRGPRVAAAISRLRSRGCDVRSVYSLVGEKPVGSTGARVLRTAGVRTSCLVLMHDKFAYFDVVDRTTRAPRKVLWTGSQNFGLSSITANDDTLMSSTAEFANARWAPAIRATSNWYRVRWEQMYRNRTDCPR